MKLCSKRYNVTRMARWTDTPPDTTATLLDRTDHEQVSQTDLWTGQTDRPLDTPQAGWTDRPPASKTDGQTDTLLHRQIPSHADRQTGRQTSRETDIPCEQTDGSDRHVDSETESVCAYKDRLGDKGTVRRGSMWK